VHVFAGLGVRMFFVISGYLITTLLLRELQTTGRISLRRFYFRRTLRIFPPYYAYLTVVALLVGVGWLNAPADVRWLPALTYTSNLVAPRWWVIGHGWTLSAEEQFYLYWPFLVLLLGSRRSLFAALAIIALCPIIRVALFVATRDSMVVSYWSFDYMAAGSVLALGAPLLAASKAWMRAMAAPPIAAVAVAIVLALFHHGVTGSIRWLFVFDIVVARALEATALATLVAWCVANHATWLGRMLNARPMRALGVLSYSLYLWQELFLRGDTPITGPWALLAAFVAAACAYALVERPALALRPRLERRYRARRSAADSSALAA
jgi:peptidoglycan/LPS O-acetylase OafA/YrhL